MFKLLPLFLVCTVVIPDLSHGQVAQRPEVYNWIDFSDILTVDNSQNRKILVDVFSPNCTWCARMYREVYSDSTIVDYLSNHFEMTQLDLEDFETQVTYKDHVLSKAELAYGLGATGTPTTVFLEHNGDYITRLEGFHKTTDFLQVLQFIATDAYTSQSFADFVTEQSSQ
ncbi:MAG: thioredoxin fold domain-containing protein [Rhodothermales bacterium]|nr:thioredoxin fold domain-containing protein [Rhodothermales bacterium]